MTHTMDALLLMSLELTLLNFRSLTTADKPSSKHTLSTLDATPLHLQAQDQPPLTPLTELALLPATDTESLQSLSMEQLLTLMETSLTTNGKLSHNQTTQPLTSPTKTPDWPPLLQQLLEFTSSNSLPLMDAQQLLPT